MALLARRETLATEAYQDPQGKMDKLALLGSWDHRGLLAPLAPQVLDVQQNLDMRILKARGTSSR